MEQEKELSHVKALGINANVLKVVAVVSMLVDHSSRLIVEDGTPARWWMHLIGRLAMPLICYLIAEGHHYTSNKKAYAWRLLLFALVSHLPYVWYFNLNPFTATSVMWTLMLGLIALTGATNKRITDYGKVLCVGICCALAIPANWNYVGVLWIVAFGVLRENFKWKTLAFIGIGLLFYVWPGFQDFGLFVSYRLGFLLAVPIFYFYNRQPGKRSLFAKWAFYWFYPIHLVVLLLIRMIVR